MKSKRESASKTVMSLRQWRRSQEMTQEDFAALIGCSRPEISLIECGKRRPRQDIRNRILAVVPVGVVI